MRRVSPVVRLVARPSVDYCAVYDYLADAGGTSWEGTLNGGDPDSQDLTEMAGRTCYRSWEPGLNPNVTRVRDDKAGYFRNILESGHGSVLEHAQFSFAFQGVSRVLTHELARHRAGCAVSQESLRFVRLDEIPFWMPEWAEEDSELRERAVAAVKYLESLQLWMADHFCLNDAGTSFHEKKQKTSFMRRLAPEGLATTLVWSANVRAIRHVVEARTAPGAEEEMRLVFGQVARLMRAEVPLLMQDFTESPDGSWVPRNRKV